VIIRVGIDLVSLADFSLRTQDERFLEMVFSQEEREYCDRRATSVASYAARFAAKEAFVKALGTGFFGKQILPKDIWIISEDPKQGTSRPLLQWTEKVEQLFSAAGFNSADVSLSHTKDYAAASVVLYG